ncbi:MAG TPA: hypothetical protein VM285_00255, partial [Polyangia bacterium]|nr:hypothetical protein [Polyangia bacterium]
VRAEHLMPLVGSAPITLLDHTLGMVRHGANHLHLVPAANQLDDERLDPEPARGHLGNEMLGEEKNSHLWQGRTVL